MDRLRYWLPVILLCAAIFVQSSFPPSDMGPTFPMQDKALHVLAYGLLADLIGSLLGAAMGLLAMRWREGRQRA